MLPELVIIRKAIIGDGQLLAYKGTQQAVLETELLHLCRLAEEKLDLDSDQEQVYINALGFGERSSCDYPTLFKSLVNATWQRRVPALVESFKTKQFSPPSHAGDEPKRAVKLAKQKTGGRSGEPATKEQVK